MTPTNNPCPKFLRKPKCCMVLSTPPAACSLRQFAPSPPNSYAPWCAFYTAGNVFCHHIIIIIMEIDDNFMAKIPNNQPHVDGWVM